MKLKKNQAWHFIRRDENGIDRLRDGTEGGEMKIRKRPLFY